MGVPVGAARMLARWELQPWIGLYWLVTGRTLGA